jgi:hypothetical protein
LRNDHKKGELILIREEVTWRRKWYGDVRERRCAKCNKILAAYLVGEGNYMGNVRKFEN